MMTVQTKNQELKEFLINRGWASSQQDADALIDWLSSPLFGKQDISNRGEYE